MLSFFSRCSVSFVLVVANILVSQLALAQADHADRLVPQVISERPHSPEAFTQGLVWFDGFLYESTGHYGRSSLRQVDPESGEVLLQLRLSDSLFGEGLALVDENLYQITWREQVALRVNLSAFTEAADLDVKSFQYEGQGWGLCYDGEYLFMSDGSETLFLRDPETFDVIEERIVTFNGTSLSQITSAGEPIAPVPQDPGPDYMPPRRIGLRLDQLNELECVEDSIYANVWLTDLILRIDKESGAVTAVINAAGLLSEEEQNAANELNGIAYLPESDTFLITGKYWPKMFEVNFVPAE
jgi:glutaminyl-peptide cyclotransferase